MAFATYNLYSYVKALHIISFIAWMAALLYLPRLFVYHSMHQDKVELSKVFSIMQGRLIKIIMTPGLFMTLATGLFLIHLMPSYLTFWWMQLKLLLICLLVTTHCYFIKFHMDFISGQNKKKELFFRIINEVPTVLMIAIVLLIVLKS